MKMAELTQRSDQELDQLVTELRQKLHHVLLEMRTKQVKDV